MVQATSASPPPALDKNGLPIADDEPIHAQTSLGQLAKTERLSKNGEARFYLYTDATQPQSGRAQVKVAYKDKSETITIRFDKIRGGIVQGSVHDVSGSIIADATVQLVRKQNRIQRPIQMDTSFSIMLRRGDATLNVSKAGYYNLRLETNATVNSAQVLHPQLHPIADGTLIGKVFVLDARYGGSERGTPVTNSVATADLNLAVVKALKEMLETCRGKRLSCSRKR